jgi:uncharacterized protein YndB with AHSA1/START domain
VDILAPREKVYSLLVDMEKRFRLHPEWEVLRFEELAPRRYRVRLRKESGEEKEYTFVVTELSPRRIAYSSEGGDLEVELVLEEKARGVRLTHTERFSLPWKASEKTLKAMEEELRIWLQGIKHYCEMQDNIIARTSKFIIDRFLLRLSPAKRRVAMLIILINGGILLMFTLMLVGFKVASWIR